MLTILALALMLEGDIFMKGSLDEVLRKAESENKLVMVDVYTTWCGPCKRMDKTTLADERVLEALGQNFISYKVDAEAGDGIKFAQDYKVTVYPTFFVLNTKGEVVARRMGFQPTNSFLAWLRTSRMEQQE